MCSWVRTENHTSTAFQVKIKRNISNYRGSFLTPSPFQENNSSIKCSMSVNGFEECINISSRVAKLKSKQAHVKQSVCVCVYVYVCECVCVHACMWMSVTECACACACTHVCIHVCAQAYNIICVCIQMCMHKHHYLVFTNKHVHYNCKNIEQQLVQTQVMSHNCLKKNKKMRTPTICQKYCVKTTFTQHTVTHAPVLTYYGEGTWIPLWTQSQTAVCTSRQTVPLDCITWIK